MSARSPRPPSTWVFYTVQGQPGDDPATPNVFRVQGAASSLRLKHVRQAFPPSRHTSAQFHFRFKISVGSSSDAYCYMDLTHAEDPVPLYNKQVHVKALPLASARQSSSGTSSRPSGGPAHGTAAAAAPGPAPASLVPVPEHKVPDLGGPMPEHIDEDLRNSGKSDFVIAGIQRRRDADRARHAARLKALEDREAAKLKAEADKDAAQAKLGTRLKEWRLDGNGQTKNIRTLLCTLHSVLWEGAKWKPVSLAELVNDRKVHVKYLRACAVVHPDKNVDAGPERKLIAERVFEALNEAKKLA